MPSVLLNVAMFAAFLSLGSNQKMKIVAFVDHNIILACWSGMAAPGVHPAKARRIAANIAKLPQLLGKP